FVPQTLGSASQPVRFSTAAAPLPDRTDTFVASALLSSSDAREGVGSIQANAMPGGQSSLLEHGNNNADALRGATAPEMACNAGGVCMVVWDQHERCTTHTIEYLEVDDGGGEGRIEPVIYWIADYYDTNPADGGYKLVWNPLVNGIRDLPAGVRVGPNANGFPIEIEACGEGRIDIYEADTETITDNPSNLDLIGSSLRIIPGNFAYPNGSWWVYTRSGFQTRVALFESMPRMNLDTVRGALVGPTGNVLRPSFAIPAALPTSQAKSHNFQPAVASDGVNFLVVSELADETNYDTYLDIRLFDPAGNLIGQPSAQQISTDRLAIGPTEQGVALDVAWIGDRYLVAYKFMSKNNEPRTIFIRNFDAAGTPLGAGWTTATTQAVPTASRPALAYNPRSGETLLLYLNQGSGLRGILYDGASLAPVLGDDYLYQENSTLPMGFEGYSSPLVSYNPMVDGWLISGARVTALGGALYSLWRRDLSSRLVSDQVLPLLPVANYNTQGQACPADSALPAVDLRLEERPGATLFADSSGWGKHATCSGAACPVAALPGAVDNLGNAVGTPASDFAVRFDGGDDRLTLPNSIGQAFTIAFWYKANATNQGDPFTINGGSGGFALRIYNTTSNVEIYSGNTVMQANTSTLANKVLYDGQWHFVVATRDAAGTLALYLDGNATPVKTVANSGAPAYYNSLQIQGGGTAVVLDQFQLYTTALSGATVNDLYDRTLQSYCVGTRYHQNVYQWLKLNASTPDVRGGKLTAGAQLAVTIDGDRPTSTIAGLGNGQYIAGNTIHTIGGNATDATSGAAGVDVSVNGGAFAPANGAASWAYNLAVTEGRYTIQSRATDVAGNVETPGAAIAVIADATPPNVALTTPGAAPVAPGRDGNGGWFVTLGGTAQDPQSGGQPGSGVQPESLQVLLVAQPDDDTAQGNGWQEATLSGGSWTLDYRFAEGLIDPSGVYTVFVRAADRVGNRTADDVAMGTLQLDGAGPVATLNVADAARAIITDTITISGVITDTGPAGVQQVEVSFVPLEQIAALPVDVQSDEAAGLLDAAGRVWLPATPATVGAGVTAWSMQIPEDLEGEYQLDVRGTDTLGNRLTSPNLWRGVIDTRAPRVTLDATHTGVSYVDSATNQLRYEFIYTCSAEDRYLVEQEFVCDGNALQPPQRFFTQDAAVQALFPDRTILSKLVNTYARWEESLAPAATTSACDAFGRCSTAGTEATSAARAAAWAAAQTTVQAPAADAPQAVIVAPGNLRTIAAAAAFPVTVAATAGQGLRQIVLALDGADVGVIDFAEDESITRVQRNLTIPLTAVGVHTLVARATDWSGATQTTLFPITVTVDGAPPTVTLDTNEVTPADTWQLGSDMLRFHGTAGDDIGLAAVKIQVDGGPFVNALFDNGAWRAALPVTDPEGRDLPLVVQAIDFAGHVTEVNRTVPTRLSAPDAPDTAITTGPANPSGLNTATFTFTGTPGGRDIAAFECRLDGGAFAPCATPWSYADLSQGSHTFDVRAVDESGYVDLSPASVTWTVDTGALAVTITAAPENPTTSRDATFSFAGSPDIVG
ncbi:MAG: hypothetical protein KDE20_12995, partial [Caldilineaceae bacterium]|nr:hypothetical protein [Caldilineaceae bacterium]